MNIKQLYKNLPTDLKRIVFDFTYLDKKNKDYVEKSLVDKIFYDENSSSDESDESLMEADNISAEYNELIYHRKEIFSCFTKKYLNDPLWCLNDHLEDLGGYELTDLEKQLKGITDDMFECYGKKIKEDEKIFNYFENIFSHRP